MNGSSSPLNLKIIYLGPQTFINGSTRSVGMKLLMQQSHGNNPEFSGQAIWCFVWALMRMLSFPTWLTCKFLPPAEEELVLGGMFGSMLLVLLGTQTLLVVGDMFACFPPVIGVLSLAPSSAC